MMKKEEDEAIKHTHLQNLQNAKQV